MQISRFLKEFCDFETYETPAFRHPFIEGNMSELQKIGLLGELTDLDIYVDNSFNSPDEPEINPVSCSLEDQIKQVRDKYFPKEKEEEVHSPFTPVAVMATVLENHSDLLNNTKKPVKKASGQILSEVEQLNVDVPMNRDKFRNFFMNGLQEYMKSDDFDPSQND